MQYLRMGPTPWVITSQPASVSMGEPQLPIFTDSHDFGGAQEHLRVAPVMGIVGEHDEEVLVVLPREHRVAAVDAAGEKRHALVLHGAAIEREHAEMQEVLRLDELRQDGASVVGGVGGVIHDRAVVLGEADEAGVLDAVALIGRDGKMMRSLMASLGEKRSS